MKLPEIDELLDGLPPAAQAELGRGPADDEEINSRFCDVLGPVTTKKSGAAEATKLMGWRAAMDTPEERRLAEWLVYALCGYSYVTRPLGSEKGDGDPMLGGPTDAPVPSKIEDVVEPSTGEPREGWVDVGPDPLTEGGYVRADGD